MSSTLGYVYSTNIRGVTFLKSLKRYLDETKQRHELGTNNELCHKVGVPKNRLLHWYHGVCHPTDEAMVKLARLLKINPLEIIACVNDHKAATSIKRERNPKRNAALRRFWWQLYNKTAKKR